MSVRRVIAFVLGLTMILWAGHAIAADPLPDQPGQRFHIRAADMPAPYATSSVANSQRRVGRPAGLRPQAPPGFRVSLFHGDIGNPRALLAGPDGAVYVARSRAGVITLLRDRDGDGRADGPQDTDREVWRGLDRPHGLAFDRQQRLLYVADLDGIHRARIMADGGLEPGPMISPKGAFGGRGGHWTRNIALSPDGRGIFAAIGSRGNIAEEPLPRASVQYFAFTADGRLAAPRTWAAGLRNPVGIGVHPRSGDLYTVVNERDGMGDGLVPDYLAALNDGDFFGWPYAYIGPNPMPGYGEKRPELVARSRVPEVLFQSHSAPIGIAFAAGGNFPPAWQDDMFVAMRGSWNAARPTGYKVVRIPFANGRPRGDYVNFLTGFRLPEPPGGDGMRPARVWGRPTGLAVMPDGALLVSDDTGGSIWRVSRRLPDGQE